MLTPSCTRRSRGFISQLRIVLAVAIMGAWSGHVPGYAADEVPPRPRNVILLMADDLGYGDLGCYGSPTNQTPQLDRMAQSGMRFTDFLVSSAVCSASRAALLTGRFHRRVGIDGALGPSSAHGISDPIVTLAEVCREAGMATACFGKWHLGHLPPFLPLQHGFDEYYGLPYSNDMWPFHPDYVQLPATLENRKRGFPDLPLLRNNEVELAAVTAKEQANLTHEYSRHAVDFIRRHQKAPFFLYLPYTMVHVPLFVSAAFENRSGQGLYADALLELDASVGSVLDVVYELGLEKDTLIIFLSDNGPWLSYGDHAGTAGILREGKGTSFEGGFRVPAIFLWPGFIPANSVCHELAASIDIFPTVSKLLGAKTLGDVDGKDLLPLLQGTGDTVSPHDFYPYYYADGELQAVRSRRWKLHFPHSYVSLQGKSGGTGGTPAPYQTSHIEESLYDLVADPSESNNLHAEHPDVVQQLKVAAEEYRRHMGDKLTSRPRPAAPPARRD